MLPPYDNEAEAEWYEYDINKKDYVLKDGAPQTVRDKYQQYQNENEYLKKNGYIS